MDPALQSDFDAWLSDPFERVVERSGRGARASAVVDSWRLPLADRWALMRWGVPIHDDPAESAAQLVGHVQSNLLPAIEARGFKAYRLARAQRFTICALEESGAVLGIPDDGAHEARFVNSSIVRFLDAAWRWGGVRKVLVQMQDSEQLSGDLCAFADYVHRLDPLIDRAARHSWWRSVVRSW